MSRRRPYTAERRHPVTGKKLKFSGKTLPQLHAKTERFDRLREEFIAGDLSREDFEHRILAPKSRRTTLERAARAYIDRPELGDETRRNVASFLQAAGAELAPLELGELTAKRILKWIENLSRSGRSQSTILKEWRRLTAIVRYATERGWLYASPWGAWRPVIRAGAHDPARGKAEREAARSVGELVELCTAARAIDREELARIHELAMPYALEAKIATTSILGLRQGELGAFAWHDLEPRAGVVMVARGARGALPKARRVHVLTAPEELFALLELHRREIERRGYYAPDGPVFPGPDSRRGAPAFYGARTECLSQAQLRAAVERAGLPNVERWSVHSLRDTFVTLESQGPSGRDLSALMQRTRHASRASLLRYLRAHHREIPPPGFTLPTVGTSPMLPPHGGDTKP